MEGSSWKTWAVVLVLIAGMGAAVLWLRPDLRERFFPTTEDAVEAQPEAVADATKKTKKRAKKRRKDKRDPQGTPPGEEADFVDDYVPEDRFVIGDIFADQPDEATEAPEPTEPAEPEYIPPPEVYQPNGKYVPRASWSAKGASTQDVVEISMSGGDSAPLTPGQISQTLSARTLMPCYDEVARKVPQMRGDVAFRVQVEGDGRPSRVHVTRSKLRSQTVEQCMVDRIRKLKFPASRGDRRTRFDLDFTFD
ncbi:MAG: AgmX/PglI C-terminal domain-containing protein [bacterium]